MPNGKPIATDLQVLRAFKAVPAFSEGQTRYGYLGITEKQLWILLSKRRFDKWIEYTWNPNNGWLTDEGLAELERLTNKEKS